MCISTLLVHGSGSRSTPNKVLLYDFNFFHIVWVRLGYDQIRTKMDGFGFSGLVARGLRYKIKKCIYRLEKSVGSS